MNGLFKEMQIFSQYRAEYLSDDEYRALQEMMLENPKAGAVIQGTGGLRKLPRAKDGKGKRGGVRVIYYWYVEGKQFWMFTLYSKGGMSDLTTAQKKVFKKALESEKRA